MRTDRRLVIAGTVYDCYALGPLRVRLGLGAFPGVRGPSFAEVVWLSRR